MNRCLSPGPACLLVALAASSAARAGQWTNPDLLALFFEAQMTQDEKLALVDGHYGVPIKGFYTPPPGALGSAGFVQGATALGLPNLQ